LAGTPEIGISEISEDVKKKGTVIAGFSRNCLRMEKPQIKFSKFGHLGHGSWVWARNA
jgi:hypothetical protein